MEGKFEAKTEAKTEANNAVPIKIKVKEGTEFVNKRSNSNGMTDVLFNLRQDMEIPISTSVVLLKNFGINKVKVYLISPEHHGKYQKYTGHVEIPKDTFVSQGNQLEQPLQRPIGAFFNKNATPVVIVIPKDTSFWIQSGAKWESYKTEGDSEFELDLSLN